MYDLKVVVDDVLGFCDLPMHPGDYFEVRGGRIYVPEGGYVCMWALQSLMPILPAKQRQIADDNDWLPFVDRLCCPDPNGRVVFRIERINGTTAAEPVTSTDCQRGRLLVKPELCTSCGECVRACTSMAPGGPRIRISDGADGARIGVCRQCGNARCVACCPTGALARAASGAIVVNPAVCSGCGQCVDQCPFNAIWQRSDCSEPTVCDLCQGKPGCTRACPTGALQFTAAGQSTCG